MKVLLFAPVFAIVAIGLVNGDECGGIYDEVYKINWRTYAQFEQEGCINPNEPDYKKWAAEHEGEVS